ncbi:MAG: GIY-YIG nuclease family protein, partial [bacterium]|nr:GIY-YIG nuclease family protein [bacterium]
MLVPGIASAHATSSAENRVWAFDLPEQIHVAGQRALTSELHQGCELAEYDSASGSPLAARGGDKVGEGIYEFTGQSGKKYVGQSGDVPRRIGEHARSGKLPDENPVSTTGVPGGKTAREIAEQQRIDALGGIGNLENKVNPIG